MTVPNPSGYPGDCGCDGRHRSPRHNLPRGPRARRDRAVRAALIVLALAAAVALVVAW